MLIMGKAVFKCPKDNKEVTLQQCYDADGHSNRCPFLQHWHWVGTRPAIGCSYDEYVGYRKDTAGEGEKPANGRRKV